MAKGIPTGSTVGELNGEGPLELQRAETRSNVLRWLAQPVEVGPVCENHLPGLFLSLIGNHGCRVFIGPTEDLTGWVLRVYSGERTLAVFPRVKEDWLELQLWADGPTVIDDIARYGDEVVSDRPRRRRSR